VIGLFTIPLITQRVRLLTALFGCIAIITIYCDNGNYSPKTTLEHLSQIEKESLAILEQIEYCFDTRIPTFYTDDKDSVKHYEITLGDLDLRVLAETENLYNVAKYFTQNGLPFEITFDLVNNLPQEYLDDQTLTIEMVQIGFIDGEDEETIKDQIRVLKNKILNKKDTAVHISYNINIGKLTLDKVNIIFEGKQKDIAGYLIEQGLDIRTSWEELFEQLNDQANNAKPTDTKKRSISTAVNHINKRTEKYLLENIPFIDRKDNEYWLQYKVAKGS